MENELYVITCIFWNIDKTDARCEKRYTDSEHIDKCIDSCKADAKTHERIYGKAEIHKNKAYMCFDGYLYTGDYITQIY